MGLCTGKGLGDTIPCEVCKYAVTYIEGIIGQNQTEQQIVADIEAAICAEFPPLEQMCDEAVVEYVPQIIQYLENEGTPDACCDDLGICTASSVEIINDKYRRT